MGDGEGERGVRPPPRCVRALAACGSALAVSWPGMGVALTGLAVSHEVLPKGAGIGVLAGAGKRLVRRMDLVVGIISDVEPCLLVIRHRSYTCLVGE